MSGVSVSLLGYIYTILNSGTIDNIEEFYVVLRGGADKFLPRPGRKQATATELGIYSTYSPRSSIHFLSRCSNFCKPQKKNEFFPSYQASAKAINSASEDKWRNFSCFFQSREQLVVHWGQIRRIGWV